MNRALATIVRIPPFVTLVAGAYQLVIGDFTRGFAVLAFTALGWWAAGDMAAALAGQKPQFTPPLSVLLTAMGFGILALLF